MQRAQIATAQGQILGEVTRARRKIRPRISGAPGGSDGLGIMQDRLAQLLDLDGKLCHIGCSNMARD
ncbi:hypothetical protein [Pannonibacter sp.]|uniref:hypothetical protein n=1 Tax=Pannonibacter sp. TaxID=1906786 RepID=UPI003F722905